METFLAGVAAGLTVAAVVAGARWLSVEANRKGFRAKARHFLCRHDWHPVKPKVHSDDTDIVLELTTWREECVKCGARR